MPVTIDASAVAVWLLPDEASLAADRLYVQALQARDVFQAPALLRSGGQLATKDAALRRQASKAGVLCLEL